MVPIVLNWLANGVLLLHPASASGVIVLTLSVVVTLSFNAKMDLANFECNVKTRDSLKWPRKGDLSLWERRRSGPETR